LGSRATVAVAMSIGIAAGACAPNRKPDLSAVLIKRGEPSFSFDALDHVPQVNHTRQVPVPSRRATDGSPHPRYSTVATVETTDKALARVLAELRTDESTENHRRAAAEYRRLRILDKAYDHLTAASKLDSECGEVFAERAQIWRDWGFPQLGLSDAHRGVFFAPNSALAVNTLGTLLQAVGARDAARSAYLRVLSLDPDASYALSNLCYLSFLTGHLEQAVTECESAVDRTPELRPARNNLALTYAASGRLDEAHRELLRIGTPPEVAFNVGMVYMASRQYELAERAFRRAAALRPDFSIARKRQLQAARLAAEANR
jgi:Flp pilus assembly protein TadD